MSSINTNYKESSIYANSNKITYIGRIVNTNNHISFSWSGVYVCVKFKGNYLNLSASDTKKNYFNIWIDKEMSEPADKVITISNEELINLYEDIDTNNLSHKIIIQKRTEGDQGTTTFKSFHTDGEFLDAPSSKNRLIEYIGDSYTCGFGTESDNPFMGYNPAHQNCNLSYAALIAHHFNADYILIAHSGMGVTRNYNDICKGVYMPDRYKRSLDEDKDILWNANSLSKKPDISIIYLGTNDFSAFKQPIIESFSKKYLRLLKQVKSNYGDSHPILCIAGAYNPMISEYIQRSLRESDLQNVAYMSISKYILAKKGELGEVSHPNYKGHKKLALAIMPYISSICNWELNFKI